MCVFGFAFDDYIEVIDSLFVFQDHLVSFRTLVDVDSLGGTQVNAT